MSLMRLPATKATNKMHFFSIPLTCALSKRNGEKGG